MNLTEAVLNKDFFVVKHFLEQGADPNICNDDDRVTPLHFAALYNLIDIAKLLVTAGAKVNAYSRPDYMTPRDTAELHDHRDMVKFLTSIPGEAQSIY